MCAAGISEWTGFSCILCWKLSSIIAADSFWNAITNYDATIAAVAVVVVSCITWRSSQMWVVMVLDWNRVPTTIKPWISSSLVVIGGGSLLRASFAPQLTIILRIIRAICLLTTMIQLLYPWQLWSSQKVFLHNDFGSWHSCSMGIHQ